MIELIRVAHNAQPRSARDRTGENKTLNTLNTLKNRIKIILCVLCILCAILMYRLNYCNY